MWFSPKTFKFRSFSSTQLGIPLVTRLILNLKNSSRLLTNLQVFKCEWKSFVEKSSLKTISLTWNSVFFLKLKFSNLNFNFFIKHLQSIWTLKLGVLYHSIFQLRQRSPKASDKRQTAPVLFLILKVFCVRWTFPKLFLFSLLVRRHAFFEMCTDMSKEDIKKTTSRTLAWNIERECELLCSCLFWCSSVEKKLIFDIFWNLPLFCFRVLECAIRKTNIREWTTWKLSSYTLRKINTEEPRGRKK